MLLEVVGHDDSTTIVCSSLQSSLLLNSAG
jgi:hypothetical protein